LIALGLQEYVSAGGEAALGRAYDRPVEASTEQKSWVGKKCFTAHQACNWALVAKGGENRNSGGGIGPGRAVDSLRNVCYVPL